MKEEKDTITRRGFLEKTAKSVGLFTLGAIGGKLIGDTVAAEEVWQIDPSKCIQCGNCADHCVLTPSASKCVHEYSICGYCRICSGFNPPDALELDEAAENQRCPTGAITRTFVEEPYYEYTIDRDKCIGCAECVKGCTAYGNGSLYMQIQRDLCVNCNQCAIALACDGNAISRVPADKQYLPKGKPAG